MEDPWTNFLHKYLKMSKFNQGRFKPYNPHKYNGDVTNIVYRSSWELKFMRFLDSSPDIISWKSEEFPISYKDPVTNRVRRYFPDFYVKKLNKNGILEELVVEIKPQNQTVPPTKPTKKNVAEYLRNQAKWKAAGIFCESRNFKFLVLTEQNLGIPKGMKKEKRK